MSDQPQEAEQAQEAPEIPKREKYAPVKISKLSDLEQVFPIQFEVELLQRRGLVERSVLIPARRLTPEESAILTDIIESVVPPFRKNDKADEGRYDTLDPKYLKDKANAQNLARALGVYWCVPVFSAHDALGPNETDRSKIHAFIQRQNWINEGMLEYLWAAIRNSGVDEVSLVNFSSGGASTKS